MPFKQNEWTTINSILCDATQAIRAMSLKDVPDEEFKLRVYSHICEAQNLILNANYVKGSLPEATKHAPRSRKPKEPQAPETPTQTIAQFKEDLKKLFE